MEKHDSSNWQVGDLALCIKHGRWRNTLNGRYRMKGPQLGSVNQVVRVARSSFGAPTLYFHPWPRVNFLADRFVKTTPPALDDDDEREINDLLDQTA